METIGDNYNKEINEIISMKKKHIMEEIERNINKLNFEDPNMKDFKFTWNDFEADLGDKKFIMFGAGVGADFYFLKYGNYSRISMVVDNNHKLQGLPLQAITVGFACENELLIRDPASLDFIDKNTIILITSMRYYNEIATELKQKGMNKFYSLLCMEAQNRNVNSGLRIFRHENEWGLHGQALNPKKICVATNCDGVGHALAILLKLFRIRSDLDVVWLVKKWNIILDKRIRKILQSNIYACDCELSNAYLWIGDNGVGSFPTRISKRKDQVSIELKHWSSITLKKFALDEKYVSENPSIRKDIELSLSTIDFVMVGSSFDERTCRSGLGIKKGYVHVGSPRSDMLFIQDRKKLFLEKYSSLSDKKVLLYAPTFRRAGKEMKEIGYSNELDFELIKNTLEEKFGGEWKILLRLHPFVAQYSKEIITPDYVIDVSDYQDVEEIVAASDAVITDYSSIMFEPAYISIPVFLLATDLKEYTYRERDFYIEYETLPFPIAESNDELRRNILKFDKEKYESDTKSFFDKYGVHEDGHAAERAAEFISDLIDRKVKEICQK